MTKLYAVLKHKETNNIIHIPVNEDSDEDTLQHTLNPTLLKDYTISEVLEESDL
jgi:hypothetical protein